MAVVVILLAFTMLLLVSLSALTRVETRLATNSQAGARARQHAMMAMNIALGELQRHAGPDHRVTAQGALTGADVENPWFTGVWDANTSSPAPLAWLVSGNEQAPLAVNARTALARTSDAPEMALSSQADPGRVQLVGPGSARMSALASAHIEHGAVVVPAVAVVGTVPGTLPQQATTLGRYAWWVGDEGVKASLALPDRSSEVTYPPWNTPALRARIRQQIGSGPNYFRDASARSGLSFVREEGFDPFVLATGDEAGALRRVFATNQLALIPTTATASGVTPRAFVKDRYHDFTGKAHGVLANTLPSTDPRRGLMRDLSTSPELLGTAFARYADYTSYLETPGTTTPGAPPVPAELLIADADSPRRRYRAQAFTADAVPGLPEIGFSVAPVLANFVLQFQARRKSQADPTLQVRSRLYVTLWNPYSTGFVPPADLRIEVAGLPTVLVGAPGGPAGADQPVDLQASNPLWAEGLQLPFGPDARYSTSLSQGYGAAGEMATWLPGRSYSWTTASGSAPGATLGFYNNAVSMTGWDHTVGAARVSSAGESNGVSVSIPELDTQPLIVSLKLGSDTVATYTARFEADEVPDSDIPSANYYCFGFAFRLNQPRDYEADRSWLLRSDPRAHRLEQADAANADVLIPFGTKIGSVSLPSRYAGTIATTDSGGSSYLNGNLIYRVQGKVARAMSTYNDVSLFELPRLPLLSMGELQHVQLAGRRPFSIGNAWGGVEANQVFDRFFFSGLPAKAAGALPDLGAGQPLPNWNLVPVGIATADELVAGNVAETARHLLQAGAFNVNSVSVPAWRAVLSGVRFSADQPFVAAAIVNDHDNSDPLAGTQDGASTVDETFAGDPSMGTSPSPVFFRFPQSAQEVFAWADPSTGSASGNARKFSTSAFRHGVRGYASATACGGDAGTFAKTESGAEVGAARHHLTTDQIEVLATEIVARLQLRATTRGPFRSMKTFLSETSVFAGRSLLEDAIAAAGLNADEVKPVEIAATLGDSGLSSLTLTQADLLTATAPYLRTRSDTFTIRTYGEVINPVTGNVDGKAWAEAVVQRFPETVAPTDSILQPDSTAHPFGRRFKIISFRWLSSSDI